MGLRKLLYICPAINHETFKSKVEASSEPFEKIYRMKNRLLFLFLLLLNIVTVQCASLCPVSAEPVEATGWMKPLSDATMMCKLSIPGTHDSAALYGGRGLRTQSTDITRQLRQGIRAFDIRLARKDGKLGLFHGHAFQKVYWEDDVLPAFIDFLQRHPSETLVVSLKKEGGELADYAALLSASLSRKELQGYFVSDYRPDLTLGECRGKILFLHRNPAMEDYPGAACSGWKDNASCVLTLRGKGGCEGRVLLQDEYQYASGKEADKKFEACLRNFERVAAEPSGSCRWGISFTSATGMPTGTPLVFARQVNGKVTDALTERGKQPCGIVFIDFVRHAGGRHLVAWLISSNFRQK